ncbi:epoxyqueuosine reductase [Candidatus Poribacteria bacterium]|nr:epoxyqueuosine reductase [Candidatus Poribacteria bacterium]
MIDNSPMFDEPLIGFADGDDEIFDTYKEVVGDFHWKPRDLMQQLAKDEKYEGSLKSISIIAWVLPIMKETVKSNAKQKEFPSRRWAMTREMGEKHNKLLRRHVADILKKDGFLALAPTLSNYWQILVDERVGLTSNWSERHAAYAAGLGTFSLNDGLITPRGIAHRVGSVIVNMKLKPSPRTYENHQSNCLFYNSGTCGECIKRCPAGALSESGHDKMKCGIQVMKCTEEWRKEFDIDEEAGCGLCQSGVPCSSMIPKRPSKK